MGKFLVLYVLVCLFLPGCSKLSGDSGASRGGFSAAVKRSSDGGWFLDRAIEVTSEERIDCNGRHLELSSGIISVRPGGAFEVRDCQIVIRSSPRNGKPAYIMLHGGGRLTIELSRIHFDVPPNDASGKRLYGRFPPQFLIALDDDAKSFVDRSVRIDILKSNFSSAREYSAGVLNLQRAGDPSAEEVAPRHVLNFKDNQLGTIHGAIYAPGLQSSVISGNVFLRTTLHNITVSGRNIQIENNKILFPGNGTVGDGISLIGTLQNVRVQGNSIVAGSCYGIWLKTNSASKVLIDGNTIVNGITTAIMLDNALDDAPGISEVGVRHNVLLGNAGYAVGVTNARDVVVADNVVGVGKGLRSPFYRNSTSQVSYFGNLKALDVDPEWAKRIKEYRSNSESDDVPYVYE